MVGCDNIKCLYWSLGVILEIYPGIDGCLQVAKVKTAKGECIRPIQWLYALKVESGEFAEIKSNTHSVDPISKIFEPLPRVIRTGRLVKIPNRLDLYCCKNCNFI